MDESYESLPPYPGVPFYGNPVPPPPTPPAPRSRNGWLIGALGAGAVVLAAGAFLLGRGSAGHAGTTQATALSALGSATPTPANCASPKGAGVHRQGIAGTLKSVSGTTLTVNGPKGAAVTVKTDSTTKVTKVVGGALSDVKVGATMAVHGTPTTSAGTTTIAAAQVVLLPGLPATRPAPPTTGSGGGPGAGPGGFLQPAIAKAGLAVGTVKSVSGSGFTLTSGNQTITVTTSSATTFTKTMSATVGDLTVGQPVVVGGTPNGDGSITAATIGQGQAGAMGPFGGLFGALFGGQPGGFGRAGPFASGPGRRGPKPPGGPTTTTPPTTTSPPTTA